MVDSPNLGTGYSLSGVAAVSTNDVWAVGYHGDPYYNPIQTLIEHWNGTAWSVVASPNEGTNNNELHGVAAVSPNDVWAVGFYTDSSGAHGQTLVEHWNGSAWSVVPSPNRGTGNYNLADAAAQQ